MSYAKYIGRVGALAVTLGVGVAVVTTPAVAFAQPADTDAVSSTGGSPSPTTPSVIDPPSLGDRADDPESPKKPGSEPTGVAAPTVDDDLDAGREDSDVIDDGDDLPPATGDDDAPPAADDEDTVLAPDVASKDDDHADGSTGADSAYWRASAEPEVRSALYEPDADEDRAGLVPEPDGGQLRQAISLLSPADTNSFATAAVSDDALMRVAPSRPVPARWRVADNLFSNVVDVAADLMSAFVFQLFAAPFTDQSPLPWMFLAFARREDFLGVGPAGAASAMAAPAVTALDFPTQSDTHVLVFGVDGLVGSKVTNDPHNEAFFDLMLAGTTAAGTLVGHQTVSNPSWTGIQTGVYSDTTGVINNVFTYWTYNRYPTVYNQLERLEHSVNEEIRTVAIMDGSINEPIANAKNNGTPGADLVDHFNLADTGGGPLANWVETDRQVGQRVVQELETPTDGVVPNFLFMSMAGPDNMGHEFGAGSDEYKIAVQNVNDQLGDVMDAIADREALGEKWTVIVVTDHGEIDRYTYGIGHGFQSPQETTILMIARGPNGGIDPITHDPTSFTAGAINNAFRNVDTTPTVMQLFGAVQAPWFQGKPLIDRAGSEYFPAVPGDQDSLLTAVNSAIAMYNYPSIATQLALGSRTLVATIPYLVFSTTNTITAALPASLTPVIRAVVIPLYQTTNISAQIFVKFTGVTGNHIIPPEWNPWVTSGTAS